MESELVHNTNRKPMQKKVINIAAGEAHTLCLTSDGKVYTWGRGMFGRLGTGSFSDENFPVPIKFNLSNHDNDNTNNDKDNDGGGKEVPKIVGVAAGAYHSLALAEDGSVWCWGYNTYGQLGFDGDDVSIARQLDNFVKLDSHQSLGDDFEEQSTKAQLKIRAVKAGGMMSAAIDNFGTLWMWGNCPHPSSSTDDTFILSSILSPAPILDFHGRTVVKVACGNEHVVALVSSGGAHKGDDLVCYTWGDNRHGQLGLGDTENRLRPQVVEMFSKEAPWTAYEAACGAYHTAILSLKKQASDTPESVCFTFGLGENGQLGHGTTQNAHLPEPVKDLPQTAFFVSVDCGLFHTSLVSSAGEVWSWGMEKGLGLCPDVISTGIDHGDAILPLLISSGGPYGPKFPGPIQVACGAAHTVLVTDDGFKLWAWGRGRSGVLGDGMARDSYTPTMVLWPPISDDFEENSPSTSEEPKKSPENEGAEKADTSETERKLSLAMEEINLLQSRLSTMERYASILHGSIFFRPFDERDIPASLQESGYFDAMKEWENVLESADSGKLMRMEMFYRNMLAGVKDKVMKRKIQEMVKECLQSSATRLD